MVLAAETVTHGTPFAEASMSNILLVSPRSNALLLTLFVAYHRGRLKSESITNRSTHYRLVSVITQVSVFRIQGRKTA